MEVGNVGSGVPQPRRSTLPLPLPRMGCIRQNGVDDTGGLMDSPCEVDVF